MTAELSLNNQFHSPTSSLDGGAIVVNNPNRQSLPSPWAQVVRGDTENTTAVPAVKSPSPEKSDSAADVNYAASLSGTTSTIPGPVLAIDETQVAVGNSDGGNAGGLKKAVWKKPLNGAPADTHPVVMMGAESWPALSESTRPVPKSSSESSSKPVPDASISLPQGPVISNTPHKQAKPNANANTNHSHGHPVRQRSMKRGSGGTGGVVGSPGFTRAPPPPTPPPLPPPFPIFEIPYGNLVPAVMDAPVREGPYKGNSNWVARPMGHGVNDHHSSHRNPSRRGNFGGGRPRGDGPYANGYGGRHDQDRDWHGPRGSNARDVHMPHQMVPPPHGPRGVIRPRHPGGPPFIAPQAMRPFGNPMGFDMASPFLYVPALPPEPFRGAPFIPHATPMFFPVMDPPLPTLILNQIEYYFSEANLVKDNYLRSNMDDEAWVPVTLIANFPRVQSLTNDIQLILDSLRTSMVVEVQGDKVRPRKEWKKWATTSGRFPADSSVQSPRGASDSSLPISFQKLTVDEATTKLKSTLGSTDADAKNVPVLSSVGESTAQSKLANGEVIAEACSSHI